MFHGIKNTQECSLDTTSGFSHSLLNHQLYTSSANASALLCKASAPQLSLPPGSTTMFLWMKGYQAQNIHFCLQTVYNEPVETWSMFDWLLYMAFSPLHSKILQWKNPELTSEVGLIRQEHSQLWYNSEAKFLSTRIEAFLKLPLV